MAYDWQPVYHDPPSNNWFGMQTWTMGRVAELYYATGNETAAKLLDKWIRWAMSTVTLRDDGTYSIPQNLRWTGQPDLWIPANPGDNRSLHVAVVDRTTDIGVTASLARTLLHYSAAKKKWAQADPAPAQMAKQLLNRMWSQFRDSRGISVPEERADYKRVFDETVHVPAGYSGRMPNGDVIQPGVKFIDLRSKYRNDPAFADVERAYKAGKAPVFRYHRFWAQVEAALANAAAAELTTE